MTSVWTAAAPATRCRRKPAQSRAGAIFSTSMAGKDGAFSGIIHGHLISSLPIAVSGLHDRWTAYLYDRGLRLARPVGMVEGKAWPRCRSPAPTICSSAIR